MDKNYISLNSIYLTLNELKINILDLELLEFECISFKLTINKLNSVFSGDVICSVNKVVEHIGKYIDLKEYQKDLLYFKIKRKTRLKTLNCVYSYNMFFQTLHNIKHYLHIHDSVQNFKLYQPLKKSGLLSLENYKTQIKIDNSVFYKKNVKSKVSIIGAPNKAIMSPYLKNKGLFRFQLYFNMKDTPYTKLWKGLKWKNYKIIITSYIFRPVTKYSLSLKKPKKNIKKEKINGVVDFDNIIFPLVDFVNSDLNGYYSVNINLKTSINYNLQRVYSNNLVFDNMFSLNSVISSCIHILPVVTNSYNYKILDLKPVYFSVFDVSKTVGTYTNLKKYTSPIIFMNGIWNFNDYYSSFLSYKITSHINKSNLQETINELCNIKIVSGNRIMNLLSYELMLFKIVLYRGKKYYQEGLYREITFNKIKRFSSKYIPFHKFESLRIVDSKQLMFVYDNIEVANNAHIRTSGFRNLFSIIPYYSISTTKQTALLKLINSGWLIQTKQFSISIYSNNGAIEGFVSSNNYSIAASKVNIASKEYLSSVYKRAVMILKTEKDKVFEWTEETVNWALSIVSNKNILKSNDLFSKLNLNPYALRKVINFEEKKYIKHLNIENNSDNSFYYNDILCYIETYSINKKDIEILTYKDTKIVNMNNSIYNTFSIRTVLKTINQSRYQINLIINPISANNNLYKNIFNFTPINIKITSKAKQQIKHVVRLNNKIINLKQAVFNFVELFFPINTNDYLSNNIHININGIDLFKYLSKEQYFSYTKNINTGSYYSHSMFLTIKIPENIKELKKYICKVKYIVIKNNYNNVVSKLGIVIHLPELVNLKNIVTTYNSFWMQIFLPNRADMGVSIVELYNFKQVDKEFAIHIPINYYYVDNNSEDVINVPLKSKNYPSFPSIGLKEIEAEIEGTKPLIVEKKDSFCDSPYKAISNEGFSFTLERDDKLLVGNNVYSVIENIYGGMIEEKQSMFVSSAKMNDIGLFSEIDLDELENMKISPASTKEIDEIVLTEKDFNNKISNEVLTQANQEVSKLSKELNTSLETEGINEDEFLASQPEEVRDNIKRYKDDLGSLYDSVKFKGVNTRPLIDGKLLKKIRIKEEIEYIDRSEDV